MPRYPLLGVLVAAMILCNWPFEYKEVLTYQHGGELHPLPPQALRSSASIPPIEQHLTLAGWPCKFYLSSGTFDEPRRFSFYWLGLGFNLLCWGSLCLLMAYIDILWKKRPEPIAPAEDVLEQDADLEEKPTSKSKSSGQNLSVRDLLAITAMIAMAFGYWQLIVGRYERDRQLALEISRNGGTAKCDSLLPIYLHWLKPLHPSFLRITQVSLLKPDSALVEQVVALPYLRSLNIAGGTYDLALLRKLNANPLLNELGVIGRSLDSQSITTIASMPALRRLDLMRTNITVQGLQAIGQPNLRELNIVHTDVKLSELGRPAFAGSLRVLLAPHPPKRQGDSLVLEDWPQLEELGCFELDELLNAEPVELKLKNLPKLTTIQLDILQLFDIELDGLPNLSNIVLRSEQWNERATAKQVVPGFAWVRNLRVHDVPKLKELAIFGSHAESITIDQAGPMTFGIGVYNYGFGRSSVARSGVQYSDFVNVSPAGMGYLSSADIPLTVRQKWIDNLAPSNGVEHLDYSYLPLDGLTLAPLTQNRSIRRLSLGHSAVETSQLRELVAMEQLEELYAEGCKIDSGTIQMLVKSLPKLRVLGFDRSMVPRLRLENAPNLTTLFSKPAVNSNSGSPFGSWVPPQYFALDALRIVDAPLLQDSFVSDIPLKHLHIDSAPKVSGLGFRYPFPVDAVVMGVEGLKFFAGGGQTCTDAIVSEVLKAKGLKKLTLAYTAVNSETLQPIADLHELEYLVLTGSAIDDPLVAKLGGLANLRVLRLDQTRVTNRSIPVISTFVKLETLDLGDQPLSADEAALLLTNLKELKAVNLAGAPLTLEHLKLLSDLEKLQVLDLSDTELDGEQLNWLAKNAPASLVELKLNRSKLDAGGFRELVKNSRASLIFSLRDTEVDVNLVDWLVARDRVSGLDEDQAGNVGSRMMQVGMQLHPLENSFDVSKGEIDPVWFAPQRSVKSEPNFDAGVQSPGNGAPTNFLQRQGAELFRLQN